MPNSPARPVIVLASVGGLEALLTDDATGRFFPTSEVVYELDGTTSGCHHPVGAL